MARRTVPAFELTGRVEATLLTIDREQGFETAPADHLYCLCGEGIWNTRQHGKRRQVGEREVDLRKWGVDRGVHIANYRMFSAVSAEDLAIIARKLKLPAIPHGCLGENLVVSGIPQFTKLPPNTKLFFKSPDGQHRQCVLMVHDENKPCIHPGKLLQEKFPDMQGLEKQFVKAARGFRGVLGTVYCTGMLYPGDTVIARVPKQRRYLPRR